MAWYSRSTTRRRCWNSVMLRRSTSTISPAQQTWELSLHLLRVLSAAQGSEAQPNNTGSVEFANKCQVKRMFYNEHFIVLHIGIILASMLVQNLIKITISVLLKGIFGMWCLSGFFFLVFDVGCFSGFIIAVSRMLALLLLISRHISEIRNYLW